MTLKPLSPLKRMIMLTILIDLDYMGIHFSYSGKKVTPSRAVKSQSGLPKGNRTDAVVTTVH